MWLCDIGRIHCKIGGIKNDQENSSSFPFVYVNLLIDKFFRLMCHFLYSLSVIEYFENEWIKSSS